MDKNGNSWIMHEVDIYFFCLGGPQQWTENYTRTRLAVGILSSLDHSRYGLESQSGFLDPSWLWQEWIHSQTERVNVLWFLVRGALLCFHPLG